VRTALWSLILGASTAALAMAAPGLRFSERMPGYMTPGREDFRRTPDSLRAALDARISTEDAEAFFRDPDHAMRLEGRFELEGEDGSRRSYQVEEGRFQLLSPGPGPRSYFLVYRFAFGSASGRRFTFDGRKTVRDDPGFDVAHDTTTLYGTIRRGGPDGPPVASGVLRFRLEDPVQTARFVASFRVPRGGILTKIRVMRRFLKLFLGSLRDAYL
jgi:cholesterol oxidase